MTLLVDWVNDVALPSGDNYDGLPLWMPDGFGALSDALPAGGVIRIGMLPKSWEVSIATRS
jgi:hypothetical protein